MKRGNSNRFQESLLKLKRTTSSQWLKPVTDTYAGLLTALCGAAGYAAYRDDTQSFNFILISGAVLGGVFVIVRSLLASRSGISEPTPFDKLEHEAVIDEALKKGYRVFHPRLMLDCLDDKKLWKLMQTGYVITGKGGLKLDQFAEVEASSERRRQQIRQANAPGTPALTRPETEP